MIWPSSEYNYHNQKLQSALLKLKQKVEKDETCGLEQAAHVRVHCEAPSTSAVQTLWRSPLHIKETRWSSSAILFLCPPHQSDTRGRLGHSKAQNKKQRKGKKSQSPSLLPPSLCSFPHSKWKSQSISHESSVCWVSRLLNPGQLSPLGGAHLLGPWQETKRLYIEIVWKEWGGAGTNKETDESWGVLQLGEETKYTPDNLTAGKHATPHYW